MRMNSLVLLCAACLTIIAILATEQNLKSQRKELTQQQKAYRNYEAKHSSLRTSGSRF